MQYLDRIISLVLPHRGGEDLIPPVGPNTDTIKVLGSFIAVERTFPDKSSDLIDLNILEFTSKKFTIFGSFDLSCFTNNIIFLVGVDPEQKCTLEVTPVESNFIHSEFTFDLEEYDITNYKWWYLVVVGYNSDDETLENGETILICKGVPTNLNDFFTTLRSFIFTGTPAPKYNGKSEYIVAATWNDFSMEPYEQVELIPGFKIFDISNKQLIELDDEEDFPFEEKESKYTQITFVRSNFTEYSASIDLRNLYYTVPFPLLNLYFSYGIDLIYVGNVDSDNCLFDGDVCNFIIGNSDIDILSYDLNDGNYVINKEGAGIKSWRNLVALDDDILEALKGKYNNIYNVSMIETPLVDALSSSSNIQICPIDVYGEEYNYYQDFIHPINTIYKTSYSEDLLGMLNLDGLNSVVITNKGTEIDINDFSCVTPFMTMKNVDITQQIYMQYESLRGSSMEDLIILLISEGDTTLYFIEPDEFDSETGEIIFSADIVDNTQSCIFSILSKNSYSTEFAPIEHWTFPINFYNLIF